MPVNRTVAQINRRIANRVLGPILTRLPGFGTVHHRGRRSGRDFHTPVKLFRRGTDYVITLPYGPGADWVKNVLAAGECELTTRGRRIRLVRPTLFEDDGRAVVPMLTRRLLARLDSTRYLALTPVESGVPGPEHDQR